jgi:hypothetical protein
MFHAILAVALASSAAITNPSPGVYEVTPVVGDDAPQLQTALNKPDATDIILKGHFDIASTLTVPATAVYEVRAEFPPTGGDIDIPNGNDPRTWSSSITGPLTTLISIPTTAVLTLRDLQFVSGALRVLSGAGGGLTAIDGCHISASTEGVETGSAADLLVHDTTVVATSGLVLDLDGQATISGSYFVGAVLHVSTSLPVDIDDCHIADNGSTRPALRTFGPGSRLANSFVDKSNAARIIRFQGDNSLAEGNVITGSNYTFGLQFFFSENSTARYNTIALDSGTYQIFGGAADGCVIHDNTLVDVSGNTFGINLFLTDDCVILNNDMRGTTFAGITVETRAAVRLAFNTNRNLVHQQGNFPVGTGQASNHVRDEGTDNRVTGHDASTLAQQDELNPGIGQRLKEAAPEDGPE